MLIGFGTFAEINFNLSAYIPNAEIKAAKKCLVSIFVLIPGGGST
jgi:hypothetical protein